ncbi:MAG: efflux RND transporter periplasmic adaptor subunit [Gemmatimonadaceae bacterium]
MYRRIFSRLALVTAVVALVVVAGCSREAAANPGKAAVAPPKVDGNQLVIDPKDPQLASLTSAPVAGGESASIALHGRLAWNEDATVRVFSPFAGRVTRVVGMVGSVVRAGDTLAVIASADYGQAQADARRAAADFSLAERTAARTHDLFQHDVAAQKDVEQADADLARSRAELRRAQARLALYGGDSADIDQAFVLRAPIGGVIVDRSVTVGQEVRPDQMLANAPQLFAPLFTVTNPAKLWVILDVPERDLQSVSANIPISIQANAWPGRAFAGRLSLVGDAVDPVTRTVKLRGSVDNPGSVLKAEMLVTVTLRSRIAAAGLSVPTGAVLLEGADHVAYVDEGNGRFRRAVVTVGVEHNGTIPVTGGLGSGDRVVIAGVPLIEQLYQDSKAPS